METELDLPEISYPLVVDTIGKHIVLRHGIRAYCAGCGHSADLDLTALARRLGVDFRSDHWSLRGVLKCGRCGGKENRFTVSPPTPPPPGVAADAGARPVSSWRGAANSRKVLTFRPNGPIRFLSKGQWRPHEWGNRWPTRIKLKSTRPIW